MATGVGLRESLSVCCTVSKTISTVVVS